MLFCSGDPIFIYSGSHAYVVTRRREGGEGKKGGIRLCDSDIPTTPSENKMHRFPCSATWKRMT